MSDRTYKFTRAQYMANECTHQQYYEQFVTPGVRARVNACIGLDRIRASTDPHFNDIPLFLWDRAHGNSFPSMKEAGDFLTLAGMVCIQKAYAQQIRAKEQSKGE